MRRMNVKWFACSLFIIFLFTSCASTKLTHTYVDKSFKGKTVSNILVIGLTYKEKENVRKYFEESFAKQLKAVGVGAVSSGAAVAIPSDLMLKKEHVMDAIKKYNSDAVLITFLAGTEENELFNRDNMMASGYYNVYSQWMQQSYNSSYSKSKTLYQFKTFLYDVATEKLIWSGLSQTINPDTGNQVINETIHVIIADLQKYKIIQTK